MHGSCHFVVSGLAAKQSAEAKRINARLQTFLREILLPIIGETLSNIQIFGLTIVLQMLVGRLARGMDVF
jgi:hypothetical protein